MLPLVARQRADPTDRDDSPVPTTEDEFTPPELAQRENAEAFAPCPSNRDISDHARALGLGLAQFAGRHANVTCVISAPSVSKVHVV